MPRPTLPLGDRLPWVLGAISLVLIGYGLAAESDRAVLIGGIGLAGTVVGFLLPRLLLPPNDHQ